MAGLLLTVMTAEGSWLGGNCAYMCSSFGETVHSESGGWHLAQHSHDMRLKADGWDEAGLTSNE